MITTSLAVKNVFKNSKNSAGKIGLRGIAYYASTTVCAAILGIILVLSIRPGVSSEQELQKPQQERNFLAQDAFFDLARNLVPPNIIEATSKQVSTRLIKPPTTELVNNPYNKTSNETLDKTSWPFVIEKKDNTNILGLVFFSILFGLAIATVGEEAKPILQFFTSLVQIMMKMTSWAILLSPVGIFFLICGSIVEMKEPKETFQRLGLYVLTVMLGLFIHGLIILPGIYGLVTKTLPFKFISNLIQPLTTAFGTASSSATLPVTLDALEKKNKIDTRITRFLLPIGATMNMDGTALYEAVSAIFIAQVQGVPLTFGKVLAISITATFASIGAAGIPQAGIVTMVMVLQTVGLTSGNVSLILAVDWFLDRSDNFFTCCI